MPLNLESDSATTWPKAVLATILPSHPTSRHPNCSALDVKFPTLDRVFDTEPRPTFRPYYAISDKPFPSLKMNKHIPESSLRKSRPREVVAQLPLSYSGAVVGASPGRV
jgi:hypothetical protein